MKQSSCSEIFLLSLMLFSFNCYIGLFIFFSIFRKFILWLFVILNKCEMDWKWYIKVLYYWNESLEIMAWSECGYWPAFDWGRDTNSFNWNWFELIWGFFNRFFKLNWLEIDLWWSVTVEGTFRRHSKPSWRARKGNSWWNYWLSEKIFSKPLSKESNIQMSPTQFFSGSISSTSLT